MLSRKSREKKKICEGDLVPNCFFVLMDFRIFKIFACGSEKEKSGFKPFKIQNFSTFLI